MILNSNSPRIIGIIPARINSEEVHAKVLTDLGGKSVIQHVYQRAMASDALDEVLIAADHSSIIKAAESFGAKTYQTRLEHVCGTDRIAEAAREVFPEAEIVVNIQADEPFLHPDMIAQVVEPLREANDWDAATLCCRCTDEATKQFPFTVKVVRSSLTERALYFSRAVVPYPRYPEATSYFQHIGIYAYRMKQLLRFAEVGPSELELSEGLEQLRALEAELRIKAIESVLPYARISIDTEQDIQQARQWLQQNCPTNPQ